MANKIIGYTLLFLGVIIILWGLWFSYEIFTGKTASPEIFKTSPVSEKTKAAPVIAGLPANMQEQLGALLQNQLGNLLAGDSMNKILNLTAWSIFMAILVMAAGKISLIGVALLKEGKKEKNQV